MEPVLAADRDRYDFDAPSLAVDLAELHNAPSDDTWFEKRESGQLATPMRREDFQTPPMRKEEPQTPPPRDEEVLATPPRQEAALTTPPRQEAALATPPREEEPQRGQEASQDRDPAVSNIVTSWGNDAKANDTNAANVPRRVSKRKKASVGPTEKRKKVNTEELELQRMKKLQQEVAQQRKKNEASYKAALAGNVPAKKSVLSTTVPREFNFRTDARVKNSAPANTAAKETKPQTAAKALSATVPKPFNLSTGRKRRGAEPAPYVPMAEQVQKFHKRTPERFHQPSRQAQEKGPSPVKPQRSLRAPTVPHSFSLQVEKRLQERQARRPQVEEEEEEPEPQPFKSQPIPKGILDGVTGVPEKVVASATVPESPAFALKKRIRVEPPVEVKPPSPIRPPPVPHFALPFQPKLPEHHQVELCPFSFDKREQERRVLKEKKLEQLRNEEVPKFKAQPLPDFSTVSLPEKKKLEPTKPEPFNLIIDQRGQQRTAHWEHMLAEEKKAQDEAAQFKAGPNLVIHKEPFKPKKEERLDTSSGSSSGFELETERRARERQEFERLVGEKEALRAMVEAQRRREEEEREKEEILRLRHDQVHKAQPVKLFKAVKVKKSELPLTVPQSPNFSDRFRM